MRLSRVYQITFDRLEVGSRNLVMELHFTITVDSETRIYNDVTDVRAYQIDPFSQWYGLDIEYKKPGYDSYGKSILGIRPTEIVKIAKKCYFQELKERQNNKTFTNN